MGKVPIFFAAHAVGSDNTAATPLPRQRARAWWSGKHAEGYQHGPGWGWVGVLTR
jgi:hypothetical protein